jgi:hypothetical protein
VDVVVDLGVADLPADVVEDTLLSIDLLDRVSFAVVALILQVDRRRNLTATTRETKKVDMATQPVSSDLKMLYRYQVPGYATVR